MSKIKFGTDGFRGIIDREFTVRKVRLIAFAYVDYLEENHLLDRGIVVGFDCRKKSQVFAQRVACVLADCGIEVFLFQNPTPTPVVTYSIISQRLSGGIVITASHNPPQYNGLKIKTHQGAGANRQLTNRLEEILSQSARLLPPFLTLQAHMQNGMIKNAEPFKDSYIKHLASLVDLELIKSQNWRICTNPMHGAGIGYFPLLLRGGKLQIDEVNNLPDQTFGGTPPEPIEINLTNQKDYMSHVPCAIGLALDGDADRLGVMDENGNYLSPPQVFSLLAYYMFRQKKISKGLARTINASVMLERLAENYDTKLITVPVGFKNIAESIINGTVEMGGEESGSYGYVWHMPERDGILSGLYLLEFMAKENLKPQKLLEEIYRICGKWDYQRLDCAFNPKDTDNIQKAMQSLAPTEVLGKKIHKLDTTDGLKLTLCDGSWLLLRLSGTEPLLRIYAESPTSEFTVELLEYGKKMLSL